MSTTRSNPLIENESLRKQISSLEREIESLKETIASKDDANDILKNYVESLKKQIGD